VSADGADFIDSIVAKRCPNAVRVADPFHVVELATEALDEVRRGAWNEAQCAGPEGAPTSPADAHEPMRHRDREANEPRR